MELSGIGINKMELTPCLVVVAKTSYLYLGSLVVVRNIESVGWS